VIDLFTDVVFITWSSISHVYVFGSLLRKLLRQIDVYDSTEGLFFLGGGGGFSWAFFFLRWGEFLWGVVL